MRTVLVLGVSSSSYCYWLKHLVGLTEFKSQELLLHIQQIYQKSKCRYGSDPADRKVIGWALGETIKTMDTTVAAFRMAVKNRSVMLPLLFHSGRGVQYAFCGFSSELKNGPVIQMMGRKGNYWDNAVAESFFKTIKTEMVYHKNFKTKAEAKLAIFEYIEVWYNRKRRHLTLNYLTPCQYEELLVENKISA